MSNANEMKKLSKKTDKMTTAVNRAAFAFVFMGVATLLNIAWQVFRLAWMGR